jgi:hypothetical protein
LIIDGNRMYRETVEPNHWARGGRKLVGTAGNTEARCHLCAINDEPQHDAFFNRNADEADNTFNPQNRFFIDLRRLRSHLVQSLPEWVEQVSGNQYISVGFEEYQNTLSEINQAILEHGDAISIGELERRSGGTYRNRVWIRPIDGGGIFGWRLLRDCILRISRIVIEREVNDVGGYDYFFFLEVHPNYTELIGVEDFQVIEELSELEDFNPVDIQDLRRRVEAQTVVRQGSQQFRTEIRNAYHDVCAITGCNDARGMEAAHIRNYRGAHTNHVTNGILLRVDIHRLFDRLSGPLLRIEIQEEEWRLRVDQSLMGSTYEELDGTILNLPDNPQNWPNVEALRLAGWLVD